MNDKTSKLASERTATGLSPDDPVFALAGELYERLRADLAPERALSAGVESARSFLDTCQVADLSIPSWAWILEPVFDLPVGWATAGADAEGAAFARSQFDQVLAPAIINVPSASTFLALPVLGHDEHGSDVAGAMIAVPILADVAIDDNVLTGALTGATIVGVQMENSVRARAARRSLQFAQAASRTQRSLVDPTDRRPALVHAMRNLAACDALEWGLAVEHVAEGTVDVMEFGEHAARDGVGEPHSDAARAAQRALLPVMIDGQKEATIELQSRFPIGRVERDTLASVASAVAGTVIRFRAALTIESLRRSATRRLVEAQERERSMVAADIHDGVLQQLGATAIRLELAQSRVEQYDFEAASSIIADGAREIRACARELRSLLMELRPQVLDDNGLNAALSELGRHVEGTRVEVSSQLPEDIGSEFAITIFRIVQEALTNIEKHSQAENASVKVRMVEDAIEIDITDDGVGFEGSVTGPSAEGSHLGLLGMRERAQMFGGSFSISGASGGGSEIHAVLPLAGRTGEEL